MIARKQFEFQINLKNHLSITNWYEWNKNYQLWKKIVLQIQNKIFEKGIKTGGIFL